MTGAGRPDVGQVRDALLRVHRELLEEQRRLLERTHGRLTPLQALQAAAEDPQLRWLGAISTLITDLDAARAGGDAAALDAVLSATRERFAAPDPATAFGYRYLEALQQHPAVALAQRDLIAALPATGTGPADDGGGRP